MVQMAFFLRFRSQLQRTRPGQISKLENTITRAIQDAGGKITRDRYLMMAVFDENTPGFWIDMLILLENFSHAMEEASAEMLGYSLLVGKTVPETASHLCRYLAGRRTGGGIYFDQTASEMLQPYVFTEENNDTLICGRNYGADILSRLKEIKIFIPTARPNFTLRDTLAGLPGWDSCPAVLLMGHSLDGKRDDLYRCIAGLASIKEDIQPLFIRFGSGGLNAITDSLTEQLHSIIAKNTEQKIIPAWEFLFRERLKTIPSVYAVSLCKKFFGELLSQYSSMVQNTQAYPVIILENIHTAEYEAANIVIESLSERQDFIVIGTCSMEIESMELRKWKPLFPRVLRARVEGDSRERLPELPPDLLEFGYICALLGCFFPPDMIPCLLEEAGKKPAMIARTLSLLYSLKVIDTLQDPRPWNRQFIGQAEELLGEKKHQLQALVRNLLLARIRRRNIIPCCRLLEILAELGGRGDINDPLILKSLYSELSGGDKSNIERIFEKMTPDAITGAERSPAIRYIAESLKCLYFDSIKNIRAVHASPPPDCSEFPSLKAAILLVQSMFYLGMRDSDSAMEAAKEATLLSQENNNPCHAQSYRLLALASIPRKRINETIDYLGFALENAAKTGVSQDIGMSAYYAASVQLLYGNLWRARILAEKAHRHFLGAGNPEWADKARFLEGRITFETGSYRQAIDLFEAIRENPAGEIFPQKDNLLEAWIYRARTSYQNPLCPKPQNCGPDADLFELEAMCLAGDYQKAVELSGSLAIPPEMEDFFFTEQPDWRSGFAQCELLYYSWTEFRNRMLSIYHSLAISRVSAGNSRSGGEEAVRTMQRLLRSGQYPEIDPCDAFYYYAWYRVLVQTGADQVDTSTAVSMAFKRLQSRASRIDDMEMRRQFLTQPCWNKALYQAAKEYKLI